MQVNSVDFYSQFIRGLSSSRDSIERAVRQFSDGRRVRVASDDPAAARASLELRSRLVRVEGYGRTADQARFDLGAIERTLGEVFSALSAAQTKALAGGTTTVEASLGTIATEVDSLREQVLALANGSQGGRYLFGGTATLTEPFDATGTYAGNAGNTTVPYADGLSVGTTIDGERVFVSAPGGAILTTLSDLAAALRADDVPALEALAPVLKQQMDHIASIRGEIGVRLQNLDVYGDRHETEAFELQRRISEFEDVSVDRAVVEMLQANNSYESLSSAATRVLGRSLFDYLG